jgi:hypothetical protein
LTVAETAADFSRQANVTMAGYLSKLGQEIPEFKRRFFVLQPATHLYYFLSPADTEPRGCLDLQGAVQQTNTETLPDGRCRFALVWEQGHEVVLEARSERVAQEWMQAVSTHKYSYVKEERDRLLRKEQSHQDRIRALERQVANFRLVEKDRDGAVEDATRWRHEFEQLDEAIRKLSRNVMAEPKVVTDNKNTESEQIADEDEEKDNTNAAADMGTAEAPKTDGEADEDQPNDGSIVPPKSGQASRETSLLDDTLGESGESQPAELDVMKVPGLHFGGLYNACRQLQEHVRLAGEEAQTAVEDVTNAQGEVGRLEKRGQEAEKHLLHLWEENCALRKTVKHKKREKRVLVREVRNLHEQIKVSHENESKESTGRPPKARREIEPEEDESANIPSELESSDEEKLVNELEEHVLSSIRLHEQLLAAQSPTPKSGNVSLHSAKKAWEKNGAADSRDTSAARDDSHRSPTLHAKRSLFDDESEDSSDEDDAKDAEGGTNYFEEAKGMVDIESVSSVLAEASGDESAKGAAIGSDRSDVDGRRKGLGSVEKRLSFGTIASSPDCTPQRPNPILQLDAFDQEKPIASNRLDFQSEQPRAVLLTGQATAKLACPLTDVGERSAPGQITLAPSSTEQLQVYHISFYSRKIGLQFQKVPPPPLKAKGLLTDALRTDLMGIPETNDRTAAELRTIAVMSSRAKVEPDEKKDDSLQLASSVDAVLVCGFQGFDDSGPNVRPKLGARLVAFDGVSVEVGRWTFASIRKAIQTRGRPLTLSFRNDFLNTEQRNILTRAVKDVQKAMVPSVATAELSSDLRSVHSASSHEAGAFVNGDVFVSVKDQERPGRQNFAETDSVSVMTERSGLEFPAPRTLAERRTPYSFRSFSEVGSSTSSVLSAVGPLMAHLLPPKQSEPFTPDYLTGKGTSVEETPEHQDFTSSLL